jgi:hypothetical protein
VIEARVPMDLPGSMTAGENSTASISGMHSMSSGRYVEGSPKRSVTGSETKLSGSWQSALQLKHLRAPVVGIDAVQGELP